MANKISVLLPLYNEEVLLPYTLETPIRYVDEVIITDGGPRGPSIDKTKEIIDDFDFRYPHKIVYISGTWQMENGSWDESSQRNLMLEKASGNFIMPHCGDMLYLEEDFLRVLTAIAQYPKSRIIYYPFIEFWLDTRHIRLYNGHAAEAWYPVPACSDIGVIARDLIVGWKNGPGLELGEYRREDFLFVPRVFRYHYGWISGFRKQVEKHIRNITQGQWDPPPVVDITDRIAVINWAIYHVLDYPTYPCNFPYAGISPIPLQLRYEDSKDEYLAEMESEYGERFYMPPVGENQCESA